MEIIKPESQNVPKNQKENIVSWEKHKAKIEEIRNEIFKMAKEKGIPPTDESHPYNLINDFYYGKLSSNFSREELKRILSCQIVIGSSTDNQKSPKIDFPPDSPYNIEAFLKKTLEEIRGN
jgi:hypothetical protein